MSNITKDILVSYTSLEICKKEYKSKNIEIIIKNMDSDKIEVNLKDAETDKIYSIYVTSHEAKRLQTGKFIIFYLINYLFYFLLMLLFLISILLILLYFKTSLLQLPNYRKQ